MKEQKSKQSTRGFLSSARKYNVDVAHGEKCGRAEDETSRSVPRKCFNNTNSHRSKNEKKDNNEQAVKVVRGESVQRDLK